MISTAISQIIWPRAALAGCIYCTIVRDTRGAALDHDQRFNFFPASPFCGVIRTFAGDFYRIDQPDQMERPWTGAKQPDFAFCGVYPRPAVSWNPGETYTIGIGFYPDALSAITGRDLSQFVGRMVPVDEVLSPPILELCRSFFDAVWHQGVVGSTEAFEDKIEPMWTGVRPSGTTSTKWLTDWIARLVFKAELTNSGRSKRQIARRIKSWTGVSERDLHGIGHSEQLFAKLHEAMQTGDLDWAELATEAGFADQAHMIRRMRQYTGFTPEQLRQNAGNDEAFWGYRLLRQYFTKQEGQ